MPDIPQNTARGQMPSPQGQEAQGAEAVPQPRVIGFRILVQRTGEVSQLIQELSILSFLKIVQDAEEPDTVVALNIEGRDIQKNPYVFSICYFRPHTVDVLYTLLNGVSPKKRKLEVLKHVLNMLTLASSVYKVDVKYVYQLLENAISEMEEYVSSDYDKLFSTYDSLKSETDLIKKRVRELGEAHSVLSKENYELKAKNDELTLKIRQLETYSDTVLAVKVQEWLAGHSGEINLTEFCRVHNVSEARVEQVLNKMVSEGYLETRK